MRTLKTLAIFFFLLCLQQNLLAQQPTPKTLLWRISGKGLQKPSYLYGTMHLYDRRLFFFGDSVYNSIETTEGFAMELNPDDIMDSIFSKYSAADTTSLLRQLLNEEKFDSISKQLEKRYGMPADKVTRKKIIDERENWYYKIHKKDDMKSIVDLYLYDIAHRQGKWVGGIEDVDDQFGIKDELGKDINIVDYLKNDEKDRKKYLEKMIGIYVDADLDQLDKISGGSGSHYKDILLLTRNIKMARRMDSLSHIRSSFFAVGAAHLPGDSGVIQILRSRGFTVDPVFSSKKITPEKYSYTAIEIPWTKFTDPDSTYIVEIPGKMSNLDILNGEIKFRVCTDMVTNNFYMTAYAYAYDQSPEEAIERMRKYYTTNGFKKDHEKKISNGTVNGIEIVSVKDNINYRLQIFVSENKYFMCIAGAPKKDNLFSKDAERFLSSFTITAKAEPKTADWVDYKNEEKAFSISFPKKPSVDKLGKEEVGEHMETSTYSSIDLRNGTYYMLVVNETERGFVMAADSLMFKSKIDAYKESNSTIEDIKYFTYEGCSAMSFTAYSQVDGYDFVSKLQVISRGNRVYTIANVVQKGKEDYPGITKFFRSFKILPYKPADWSKKSAPNEMFSTWAPAPIELTVADSLKILGNIMAGFTNETKSELEYISYDQNNATSYHIYVYPLSKYYWAENDSTVHAEQLERYYTDTASYVAKLTPGKFDSLIYKKQVSNGNVKGYEILVADEDRSSAKKIRTFLRGDSVYHVILITNASQINNENNSKFFTELRFKDDNVPGNVFKSKAELIFTDLKRADSATSANALNAMNSAKLTVKDLPLLFEAYFKEYPADNDPYTYWTVNESIGNVIRNMNDPSIIIFVKDNYSKVPEALPKLKINMLTILASQKTAASFSLLKDLLLNDTPKKGPPYSLMFALEDSLPLAAALFPEVSKLYSDSIVGSGIIRLACELIDSGFIAKEMLSVNTAGILHTAKAQLDEVKKDKDAFPEYNDHVIKALGKLNDKKGNTYLYQFLKGADIDRKHNAALALLKAEQVVEAPEMKKLATDLGTRTDFYKELKSIGKEKVFPKEFLSQKQFAESYLYNYANEEEDYNPDMKFTVVGEKTVVENGETNGYYLLKMTTNYDGQKETYLAICGPFDINKEKLELKKEYEGMRIFYDEKYSAGTINELFDKFIKSKGSEIK